jgi:hypothetical protein
VSQSALLRRRWVTAAAAVAALTMILVAVAAGLVRGAGKEAGPVDMRGNPVRPEPAAGTAPRAPVEATPEGIGRFVVSSAGLDVPLGSLKAVDGAIDPPGFTSAYWVRNLGVSVDRAAEGTVFVVMHSLRDGGVGPGNYLIDVERQRAKVGVGAVIGLGKADYRVTGIRVIGKDRIGAAARVWTNTPNRLVVITCLQRRNGAPSTENLVIEASRI